MDSRYFSDTYGNGNLAMGGEYKHRAAAGISFATVEHATDKRIESKDGWTESTRAWRVGQPAQMSQPIQREIYKKIPFNAGLPPGVEKPYRNKIRTKDIKRHLEGR